jgi:predicted xylose isomerase-like sugar epimerase
LCSRVLRFVTASSADPISLEELLLRHALGEDTTAYRRDAQPAAVMMIPIPKRGLLKRVDGEAAARAVRHVEDVRITAKIDQLLEPLPEAGSYLGFIFARAASADEANRAVREAHGALTFTVDPKIDVVVS